ncbi:MAG: ABC transporter substrate-binding protein [Haloarculaceae archaeon]
MLKTLGIGGTAALAGCAGGDGTDTETGTDSGPQTSTPIDTPKNATREVKGKWNAATSVDAQSLNWLQIADNTSGSYIALCLDSAWAIDNNQEIFPLWCDVSTDDAITYEIKLRENLKWGAGYGQMTADDWVYMIKNVFQAQPNWVGYPSADDWFGTNPETGESEPLKVRKTGKFTFEIELFSVDPSWPFKPVMWGQNCMPKGLLEKYVPDKDAEGLKKDPEVQRLQYSGNLGPYQYKNWKRSSQFITNRNNEYYMREAEDLPEKWDKAPYFEQYNYKVIKEESARLGALESGDITSAAIPPNKAQKYKQNDDINLIVQPQPYLSVLAYNMRENGWEQFRKKGVRQALACAVDKKGLAQGVYRGYAQAAQTMQPRWSKWYNDDKVTNYGVGDLYGKDVTQKKMKDALSDTDYSYDGDKLVNGDGEQVTLKLMFNSGQPTNQTKAEFVAQEFEKNAGIKVEVKATSSFIAKYAHNAPPSDVTPEWSAGYFNGGPRDVSTSPESWDMSVNLSFNTYPYTPS